MALNMELAERVIAHINMLPTKEKACAGDDIYDMGSWKYSTGFRENGECGTAACLAGWTHMLSRPDEWMKFVKTGQTCFDEGSSFVAIKELRLTYAQAEVMFNEMGATPDDHLAAFKRIAEDPNIDYDLKKVYYDRYDDRDET